MLFGESKASGSFRRPISITMHKEVVAFVSCFTVGAMCVCMLKPVCFLYSSLHPGVLGQLRGVLVFGGYFALCCFAFFRWFRYVLGFSTSK